jgi:hypothetical protein
MFGRFVVIDGIFKLFCLRTSGRYFATLEINSRGDIALRCKFRRHGFNIIVQSPPLMH